MPQLSIEYGNTEELVRDARQVRRIVFIEGQDVPEERELDGLDDEAKHFVGYVDRAPVAVARTRRIPDQIAADNYDVKIERVGVLPDHRGRGFGPQMMGFILGRLSEDEPLVRNAILEAQVHAMGLYQGLGFSAIGPVFDDANIPHRKMYKPIP